MDGISIREQFEKLLEERKEIKKQRERLEVAESLAEKMTAAISGESVVSSKARSAMENAADKIIEIKAELEPLEAAYQQRKLYLSAMVESLQDDIQKTVMAGIYFNGKTKEAVGKMVGCTGRHVYNIIDKAICVLDEMCT